MNREEIQLNLNERYLNSWEITDRTPYYITRSYTFENFADAFSFMTRIAFKAEEMDHHPEWFNVYNRIDIKLSTHTIKGVTMKDIELAHFMDDLFGKIH